MCVKTMRKRVCYLTAPANWRCLSGQAIYWIWRAADMQLQTHDKSGLQILSAPCDAYLLTAMNSCQKFELQARRFTEGQQRAIPRSKAQ